VSRPEQPTFQDTIRDWIEAYRQDDHHNLMARVHAVRDDGTLDLEAVVQHAVEQPDGSTAYEALPILPAVPWGIPRAGDWFVALPVAVGDPVLVLMFDASHEHWRAGDGAPQYPGDLSRFNHGSCVAVPANYYPASRALRHTVAPGTGGVGQPIAMVIGHDADSGLRLVLRTDGVFVVSQGDTVVFQINADGTNNLGAASGAAFVALASLVTAQLNALKAAIVGWTPVPNDGGAALKAALTTLFSTWPGNVAATKAKAT
jgi:hypothetical protein